MVAQRAEPRREPFELRATIRDVSRRFETAARAKGIAFDVKTGSTVPAVAIGDAAAFGQVLSALIENAVVHTRAGEVVASVSCDPAIAGRALVHVEISDTGEGIDDATIADLFDSSHAAGPPAPPRTGDGGLLRSRRLVELMDGSFGCSSSPGTGTTVWLTVPLDVSLPAL